MESKVKEDVKKSVKKEIEHKVRISWGFVVALAAVSILGFIGIVSHSLFDVDLHYYIESLWLIIIGSGLIIEVKFKKLKTIKYGLNPNNFTHLITFIIGFVAVLSGILSFPLIGVSSAGFNATKGIISIIAIIIIIIQTWIIK